MKKAERGKKYTVSEEEFLEAIDEIEKMELDELEKIAAEAEEAPHQFSKEFEEWKEAAIHELDEKAATKETATPGKISFLYRFINTPVKKAAAVAVLVGIVTLGLGGGAEAGKFPIVKFFQERYGNYIGIKPHEDLQKNEEKPQTIETVYELGWVPDGYEKEKEEVSEYVSRLFYYEENESKKIWLEQYCVDTYFSIEEQKEKYEEVKYEGNKYYYLDGGNKKSIVWYRDGYQFIIRGDVSFDEMLKMANEVKRV